MAIKGLKVTINLKTPFHLGRFTTIDSILLSLLYGSTFNDSINPYEDKATDFIAKRNGSLSGSIWFVENDTVVVPYSDAIIRIPGTNESTFFKGLFGVDIREIGKSKVRQGSGEYRALMNFYERLIAKSIYFFVDAEPDKLIALLRRLKTVGKKGKYGWGMVESFNVEDAEDNRGFYFNKFTPSKPLPVQKWNRFIETDRVAYFRGQPPYWLKTGVEPCFMPHTTLIETIDDKKATGKVYLPQETIAPSTLIASCYTPDKGQLGKVKMDDSVEGVCAFCGRKIKGGIKLNRFKDLQSVTSASFVDFHALVQDASVVCKECFYALKSIKSIFKSGTIHILREGEYEKTSPAEARTVIEKLFSNPELPYLFSWKTTINIQHTFFKGNCQVTISELMPVVCRGDGTTLVVDRDAFKKAVSDANELNELYKQITKGNEGAKTLLTTLVIGKNTGIPSIGNKLLRNDDYFYKLLAFWRKYDFSTRMMLHFFFTGKRT